MLAALQRFFERFRKVWNPADWDAHAENGRESGHGLRVLLAENLQDCGVLHFVLLELWQFFNQGQRSKSILDEVVRFVHVGHAAAVNEWEIVFGSVLRQQLRKKEQPRQVIYMYYHI